MKVALTQAEVNHLLNLLYWNKKRDGNYYSPKEQYWKRHDKIERKLSKSTFDIMDDEEKYCRGIVFSIKELNSE